MSQNKLTISYLPGADILVLNQEGSNIFINTKESVVVSRDTIIAIFTHLVKSGLVPRETLEGLLEEYNYDKS